ncbi:hypothetical protein Cgig2_014370 [Carnegiea gigantea]|uniref:Uncharacterized protein n=1 Tax=Carnegiea gigantea TaxID=171969 RepID=A0A9Q1QHP5_9CARY|nr:hypothetical protein Cgig2_014370 [Carnegiea gigantea]
MQENLKTVGLLNCLIMLLLSIPILFCGIWYVEEPVNCEKFLQKPTVAFGATLFVVAVAAVVAAAYRLNWLLGLHLLGMLVLITALLCFAFAVTAGDRGGVWWHKRVGDGHNWNRIKACLVDGDFCNVERLMEEEWLAKLLSPIQSAKKMSQCRTQIKLEPNRYSLIRIMHMQKGCCQQPEGCSLMHRNSTKSDCNNWNSDPNTLCLSCKSCKAGMVRELKAHWTTLAIVNLLFIIILIGVFFFECLKLSIAIYKDDILELTRYCMVLTCCSFCVNIRV